MLQKDFTRYHCQIALPGFGRENQIKLQNAKVLIVGAGGLGCPAAQYLAAAGIGTIGIADFDTVAVSNLHRQILYAPADAGLKKAEVACQRLQQQNPDITLIPQVVRITSGNVMDMIGGYDIIVDGTDNFETRYLLNDAAVLTNKPLVYGAIYQFEGQLAVWNIRNTNGTFSPNYRDLFPQVNATQIPDCADGGVIPTLAGIIGCMQANEVIKYITQTGELLAGKILLFDARTLQNRVIKIGDSTKTQINALSETNEIPMISAADLKIALDTNANQIELVDVRTGRERAEFNIGGKHIPVTRLQDHLEYFSGNSIKVLYCSTGKRSGEAVKLIKQKYPGAEVFSLGGGLTGLDYLNDNSKFK